MNDNQYLLLILKICLLKQSNKMSNQADYVKLFWSSLFLSFFANFTQYNSTPPLGECTDAKGRSLIAVVCLYACRDARYHFCCNDNDK